MLTISDLQVYEGVSKKNNKPYRCLWVEVLSEETNQTVRVPVFLAPWEWSKLGFPALNVSVTE